MNKNQIISIAIGIFLVVAGSRAYYIGLRGIGDVDFYSGELKFEAGTDTGAYDDTFDVYIDSPLLMRKVEMIQFSGNAEGDVILKYSDKRENVTNDTGFYNNPPFPEFPKSKNFYGLLSIGEEDVYLSDEFIDKLHIKHYIDFKREINHYPVSGLSKGKKVKGLYPIDDYTYIPKGHDEGKLGSIRVTWYALKPEELAGDFTAAGKLNGKFLEKSDYGVLFYDYKLSEKEMETLCNNQNKFYGALVSLIGLLCIVLPIRSAKKKKDKVQAT